MQEDGRKHAEMGGQVVASEREREPAEECSFQGRGGTQEAEAGEAVGSRLRDRTSRTSAGHGECSAPPTETGVPTEHLVHIRVVLWRPHHPMRTWLLLLRLPLSGALRMDGVLVTRRPRPKHPLVRRLASMDPAAVFKTDLHSIPR